MDARWLLGRAGESGAVAMDAKRLLGRAGKSVVAIGCCVKWAGRNMHSVLVHTFYWSGCPRTPTLSLLTLLLCDRWTQQELALRIACSKRLACPVLLNMIFQYRLSKLNRVQEETKWSYTFEVENFIHD